MPNDVIQKSVEDAKREYEAAKGGVSVEDKLVYRTKEAELLRMALQQTNLSQQIQAAQKDMEEFIKVIAEKQGKDVKTSIWDRDRLEFVDRRTDILAQG